MLQRTSRRQSQQPGAHAVSRPFAQQRVGAGQLQNASKRMLLRCGSPALRVLRAVLRPSQQQRVHHERVLLRCG